MGNINIRTRPKTSNINIANLSKMDNINVKDSEEDTSESTSINITSVRPAIKKSKQKRNVPLPPSYTDNETASDIDMGLDCPPLIFNQNNTSDTQQIKDRQPTRPLSMKELKKQTLKLIQSHPVSSHEVRATYSGCNYKNQGIFLRPKCLISTDKDGNFRIEKEVLEQIKSVDVPVVAIAIVGLYRTGKSYLMNRLAGVSEGFPLGNTTDSATKGIWAWCRNHPKRANTVLLLLDTEGIGDPIKGDINHDIKLITLAALLCNVLVYNIMTAFNQEAIEKLTFISEISKSITFKNRAYSSEQQGQESLILPILVVCVRDFSLMLPEKDGKEITQDEYLESTLELKDGDKPEVIRFNKPREGIKTYFRRRKCFTFDRPGDKEQMQMLEKVDINNLSKSFKKDTEKFLQYMFEQKPKVLLHSKPITGHMFTSLVDTYVKDISEGGVPDVDDAITNMAKIENERLKKNLVKTFQDKLNNERLPVLNTENLEKKYQDQQKALLSDFRKEAVFNIEKVEKEIVDELDKIWIEMKNRNLKVVKEYCSEELKKLYKQHVGETEQYYKVGGYREYKSKMVKVKQSYQTKMTGTDRFTVQEVLNEFSANQADPEQLILIKDTDMTAEERKRELSSMMNENKEEIRKLQTKHEDKLKEEETKWEKKQQDLKKERDKYEETQKEEYNKMIKKFKRNIKNMNASQAKTLADLQKQNKELKDKIDGQCSII